MAQKTDKPKRMPLPVQLTPDELDKVRADAGDMTLADYVRTKLGLPLKTLGRPPAKKKTKK
jgi:hypothetical protein